VIVIGASALPLDLDEDAAEALELLRAWSTWIGAPP
jgi:hypothetical protein